MTVEILVHGGCHCGGVRFRCRLPGPDVTLLSCNCSICTRTGFLHLIVPHTQFSLLPHNAALASYRFGTGAAEHLFCRTCGIKAFYQPRSHSDSWSVHFACLDDGHGLNASIVPFDGRNWEAARGQLR